ncbi:MAG: HD domain-containing protein [Candidatus Methanoperedens sp.]|nr:HD domain-containing protein [Candidatus Methanoperedens sp.]
MELREKLEKRENKELAPYAFLSENSKGRIDFPEPKSTNRTEFLKDEERILLSKSFRKLSYKTQVFIFRSGDFQRTRLTHTLEVESFANDVSMALELNQNLTRAISLGHDIGHTPFGHSGERILDKKIGSGFKHNEQSIDVARRYEVSPKFGSEEPYFGRNLTWEVLEGILKHSKIKNPRNYSIFNPNRPATLEGQVVNCADEIAQISSDIDDAINLKIIKGNKVNELHKKLFGKPEVYRPWEFLKDLITNSKENLKEITRDNIDSIDYNLITFSDSMQEKMKEIDEFCKINIFENPQVRRTDFKGDLILSKLFDAFKKDIMLLPISERIWINKGLDNKIIVKNYIANLTDKSALEEYDRLFLPYRE